MNARQDKVFHRLHHASAEETWFEDRTPKWHRKCRNWYLNKKSYQYVEKKRLADVSARAEHLAGPGCSSSQHTVRFTRRNTKTFEAKKRCVICNKQWLRGKEPTSKAGVSNSRPGGQIRPVTWFSVAPQEVAKNNICLLYGYMIYRSTMPINYMSHNASQIRLFFSEFDLFSSKYYITLHVTSFF